jgi:hypothetical protein
MFSVTRRGLSIFHDVRSSESRRRQARVPAPRQEGSYLHGGRALSAGDSLRIGNGGLKGRLQPGLAATQSLLHYILHCLRQWTRHIVQLLIQVVV